MSDNLSGELKAMGQLEAALKDLTHEERARVLQWGNARFTFVVAAKPKVGMPGKGDQQTDSGDTDGTTYQDFATFYDAAAPSVDGDRALVGAYWLQIHEGAPDVEAQTVNTSLKHLGHGIGNITRAFENLKAMKPALIVQTRKDGSSQQARKKFKVTSEGKKAVERMLSTK